MQALAELQAQFTAVYHAHATRGREQQQLALPRARYKHQWFQEFTLLK